MKHRVPCLPTLTIGWFLLLGTAAAVEPVGNDDVTSQLPVMSVPGHAESMRALNDLFAWHHSPRSNCTLWDGWLPISTLWPAIGPTGSESAAKMRQFYRHALSNRPLDADGYVAMNQHRGFAHPAGWPFPTWQQAGGAGWHFTHQGDSYARAVGVPLADRSGWETTGITDSKIDPDRGWQWTTNGAESSISSPAISVTAFVAPFLVIEWSRQNGPAYLEWTSESAPEFSAERRIPIAFDPQLGATYHGDLHLVAVPTHQHPQWQGKITRLRVTWTNAEPEPMTLRSVHTAIDSRHPITGSLFVRGCTDYFNWTGDVAFLQSNIERLRRAIEYSIMEFQVREHGGVRVPWVGHDGRPGFVLTADGSKQIFPGRGVGNNYWDLLPFGHDDFLATLYLYDALGGLASLERAIQQNPSWQIAAPANEWSAEKLVSLAAEIRDRSGKRFWNPATGRFVACIDADGNPHDYGFTFLNLEAIHFGFASEPQARDILDWIDGRRTIEGDTSSGPDIYHWRFAPRATTRRNIDWYAWMWHDPESIPWGGQVQDGGAVLGFSYHDLMARIKTNGPDDAWQRLQQILEWFVEVRAAGGYRPYYAVPGRGSLQGGGTPGGLGLDHEFMESVLVPQVMLYGFMGLRPTPQGIELDPQLPTDWPELTISRIHFQDHVFDLSASRDRVTVTYRQRGASDLELRLPAGDPRPIQFNDRLP